MASILCSVATRGRYHSTLPMVINATANQTKLPDKLIIFDDNDAPEDMRNNFIYQHLFSILNYKGIKWEWLFADKKGQHHIHQMANAMGYDWVWRVDDDAIPEPNVLKELSVWIDKDVGAIGGSILTLPVNPDTSKVTGKIGLYAFRYKTIFSPKFKKFNIKNNTITQNQSNTQANNKPTSIKQTSKKTGK